MLTALGGRYTQFLERLQDAVDACPANDWRTRLQTWIRVNVEAYVETYRTHDIVTPTITTMIVPTRTRTRFLTNCWTSSKTSRPAPGPGPTQVVALLIYSGVHGATDDIIAARPADCAAFAQAVADNACACSTRPAPPRQGFQAPGQGSAEPRV